MSRSQLIIQARVPSGKENIRHSKRLPAPRALFLLNQVIISVSAWSLVVRFLRSATEGRAPFMHIDNLG